MEHKIKGQCEQFVLINALDADDRNINHGDTVRVYNDRGAFEGAARITADVNPGLISW